MMSDIVIVRRKTLEDLERCAAWCHEHAMGVDWEWTRNAWDDAKALLEAPPGKLTFRPGPVPPPPDFAAVDMAAPGTSDYTESVKRLQASVLTMDQALRIVDAIGLQPTAAEDVGAIYSRAVELGGDESMMRARECMRQARAEFVLRVANEGGRE